MINENDLKVIAHTLSESLKSKAIPFKETEKQFTILCPSCLKDGKTKLKLNIDKSRYIYHCFRCGLKGSPLTLPSVLTELGITDMHHLFLDMVTDVAFLSKKKSSFYDSYLTIKNELENNYTNDVYTKHILKTAKDNLNSLRKSQNKDNIQVTNLIKSYLQSERMIEPYQLKMHKISHVYGSQGKLNCRFAIPTYLYTNYEARTVTDAGMRYMKDVKDESNILFFDYIFINLINGIQDNPFKRKSKLELPYVVITEGMFDALKLGLMNIPSISSGGVENFNKIMIFLLLLDKLYNVKISNILYIYDKDISISKIEKYRDELTFSFSKFYNFTFSRFNYEDYKDIGDIEPDKMYDFVSGIEDVLRQF